MRKSLAAGLRPVVLIVAMLMVSCGGGSTIVPNPPNQQPDLSTYVGLDAYTVGGRKTFLRLELTATSRKPGEAFGAKIFCTPQGKQEIEITTVTVDGNVRKPLVKLEASLAGRPLAKAGYSGYAFVVPTDGTAKTGGKILVSAEVDARDMALFLREINGWGWLVQGEPTSIKAKDSNNHDLDVVGWILAGIGVVGALLCPTEYGEVAIIGGSVTPPPATNHPPTLDPSGPTVLKVNQSGTWAANATDQDGDPLYYKWYINGTLMATTPSFTYTFTTTGAYSVRVEVSDGHVIVTHQWTVVVTSEQPAGPTWGGAPFDISKLLIDLSPDGPADYDGVHVIGLDSTRQEETNPFIGDVFYDGSLVISGSQGRYWSMTLATDAPAGSLTTDGVFHSGTSGPGVFILMATFQLETLPLATVRTIQRRIRVD